MHSESTGHCVPDQARKAGMSGVKAADYCFLECYVVLC